MTICESQSQSKRIKSNSTSDRPLSYLQLEDVQYSWILCGPWPATSLYQLMNFGPGVVKSDQTSHNKSLPASMPKTRVPVCSSPSFAPTTARLLILSLKGTRASKLLFSLLYTWITAFCSCAANTWVELKARQLGNTEDCFNEDRTEGTGESVCSKTPWAEVVEVGGALDAACEEVVVEQTKISVSMIEK